MAADTTSPVTMVCLTVISCEVLGGIFANLFILLVVLSDFHKKKKINSGNKIRVAMNISSIVFTLVSGFRLFLFIFHYDMRRGFSIIIEFLTIFSMNSCLFLTAVLCFFWFLKIVQFGSGMLGWMKRNLDMVVSWFIMAAEVFSFCCSFLSFFKFFEVVQKPSTNISILTSDEVPSAEGLGITIASLTLILALFVFSYILVAVTTISAAGFLRLHSQKLKGLKTSVDVSRYKSTVCKMLRFLILHTAFCCVLFILFYSGLANYDAGLWTLAMMLFSFSPASSLLLILENKKLRNAWKMMFPCVCRRILFS